MADRNAEIAAFLAGTDWAAAERTPLPGDASFRRYERLAGGPKPALLMDAPAPQEDAAAWAMIARHLCGMGFSAPEIYAADEAAGLLLIEDFGEETYTRRLAGGHDEAELYAVAVDLLAALHAREDATAIPAPAYDMDALLREVALFTEWYLPEIRGGVRDDGLEAEFLDLWRTLLGKVATLRETLVLRDYHVDNLMWLPDRDGIARCGLLDFQDATIGAPAYDLVSLLQDARRDVEEDLVEAMMKRYFAASPAHDTDGFRTDCALLAAQRNCKIIGIFTRLTRRDGKAGYLRHIPRVWGLLERGLEHPALTPMRAWIDRHVPKDRRVAPDADIGR